MALDKINSNGQTNETWREVIDAGIDVLNDDILQASTTISVYAVNDARVTGHHTINYTSSNALQDAINALPKNMSGHALTIQFQDGTYDFGTTQIYVIGFTGGVVTILGNQSDSGSGTYNVILQGQNSGGNGIISCKQCQDVIIKHLEFQHTGSGQSNYLVKSQVSNTVVYRCKFTRTATGIDNSRGIQIFDNCNARISECNFSSLNYAIYAQQNSSVSVVECHDYGTKPIYGAFAVTGAIVKPMYTDIDSSTGTYGTSSGGLITHKSGVILEETILRGDKTVNIAAGTSASDIQALINLQPRNLNGYKLTFTFAGSRTNPQEYDLGTTQLNFDGFHGGEILVQGNPNETPTNRTGFVDISSASLTSNVVTINTDSAHGLSTGDTVYLQNIGYTTTSPNGKQTNITVVDSDTFTFALTGADETYTVASDTTMNASPALGVKILTQNVNAGGAMKFEECTMVFVEHLHFEHNGNNDGSDILRMYNGTYGTVQYCIVENTNTKANDGIYYSQSQGQFKFNRVNNLDTMVKGFNGSQVGIRDNDTFVGVPHKVAPDHLIHSQGGSIVTQGSGTEYIATVSQSGISNGGVVMPHAGLILDETVLTSAKTINFAASNSSQEDKDAADVVFTGSNISDLQDVIGVQPKNLNGHNLTFQFLDGTYDFGTSELNFEEFEGGTLIVKGNPNDAPNADGSGLGVIIQSQNTGYDGVFFFSKCTRALVNRIRFEHNGSTYSNMVRFFYSIYGKVSDSSFANINGTQNNTAIYYLEAIGYIENCKFNNFNNNVNAVTNSRVCARNTATFSGSGSDQDATNNIRSEQGSIVTQSGTEAGGADSKSTGGVIFDTNGDIV